MPKARSNEDERQYEHIEKSSKKRGRSTKRAKEIAARTVNEQRKEEGRTKQQKRSSRSSRGNGKRTGGKQGGNGLESQTKDQLYQRAKKLDIEGRSTMNKRELARAIRKS
jgi:uncharacterized protein with beta-barrel porin domain